MANHTHHYDSESVVETTFVYRSRSVALPRPLKDMTAAERQHWRARVQRLHRRETVARYQPGPRAFWRMMLDLRNAMAMADKRRRYELELALDTQEADRVTDDEIATATPYEEAMRRIGLRARAKKL